MKHILFLITFCLVICLSGKYSLAHEAQTGDKEFDVNSLIMHHIKDSHEWHILDYVDSHGLKVDISLPLPIILYYNGSLDIFLSSKFKGGLVEIGDNKYIMDHEKIYVADENGGLTIIENEGNSIITNQKPLDFSITKNVLSMMIVSVILLFVFISVSKAYQKRPGAPRGLQAFVEPIIIYVRDEIIRPNLAGKTDKFLPFLLTIFFFILFNNLMGIIPFFPGNANSTGNIAVTFTLASFTFLAINLNGNKNYWRHTFWMPGVPVFVRPILAVVEIIGMVVKPVALTIRLFANITAGHIIILSLISLIFILKTLAVAPVSIMFVLFMNCLELLVALLQAYIFTMLSALFIGFAVADHNEH